jgi:hypothetical protein
MTKTLKVLLALLAALIVGALAFAPAAIGEWLPGAITILLLLAFAARRRGGRERLFGNPSASQGKDGHSNHPRAECAKCERPLVRHRYRCCGQRLCADCYLDHVMDNRAHEPPLSDETIAFAVSSASPEAERTFKLLWLFDQYGRDDPLVIQRAANIEKIKFTLCQRCDGALRHFFICDGKVFCADCWLDHCGEVEAHLGPAHQRQVKTL